MAILVVYVWMLLGLVEVSRCQDEDTNSPKTNLPFMLMISKNGNSQDWSHFIPAVDLALDKINKDDTILPQYNLSYGRVVNGKVS